MTKYGMIIDRFLYQCDQEVQLDPDGLLLPHGNFFTPNNIISFEQFSKLSGAILIAEGGMGKSTLLKQLKGLSPDTTLLMELALYNGDPEGFRSEIKSFLDSSSNSIKSIIFDGLDEVQNLGSILRIVREISNSSKSLNIWIASRDITAIRIFQDEFPYLKSFLLAPFTEKNIEDLAVTEGVNKIEFIQAIKRSGCVGICAKPLGCKLTLSLFKKNALKDFSQKELWHQGMRILCDETPSSNKRTLPRSSYSLDQVMSCTAWIAVCLVLTEKGLIWGNESSLCPEGCISISDLVIDQFTIDLIGTALVRGVFTSYGDGCFRFAHSMYHDYFAARGLVEFIPSRHWSGLLFSHDRKGVPLHRTGVASWLATFNKEFLEELSEAQAEIMLLSVDIIQSIGPSNLCSALLKRADAISFEQRHRPSIAGNLFRLASSETSRVIQGCLQNANSSESEIDFAVEIATACKCADLSSILVERILNKALPHRQRVEALYSVLHIGDENTKSRLREILPLDPKEDSNDELRGYVLRCCWPKHLPPDELIKHLYPPQRANHIGAYAIFITHDLPNSFDDVMNESNATFFLRWGLNYIADKQMNDLGDLSRMIYTYCWNKVNICGVANILAEGYLMALRRHGSPFCDETSSKVAKSINLPKNDFSQEIEKRFIVLEALLQLGVDERLISSIPYRTYPLYGQEDADLLFKKIIADPNEALSGQWAICIKSLLYRIDLDKYSEQINKVHNLRPDLIDSAQEIKEEINVSRTRQREQEQEWYEERQGYENNIRDSQAKIDSDIKTVLSRMDLNPNLFGWIARLLDFENGRQETISIDLRQSFGWNKLTPEEQNSLITMAELYLQKGNINPTAPSQHINSVAQAFTLLHSSSSQRFQNLSEEVWQKRSVELLKLSIYDIYDELLNPLLTTLSTKYPEIAEVALINVIKQELSTKSVSILDRWYFPLPDSQVKTILEIVKTQQNDIEMSFRILEILATKGKSDFVKKFLDELFGDKWNYPPNLKLSKQLLLAFSLDPDRYSQKIIDIFKKDREWGRKWIENILMDRDDRLINSLIKCSSNLVSDFYIFLHTEYPQSTEPQHETGYIVEPIDNIHEMKNRLIRALIGLGTDDSVAALEKIYAHFPDDQWMRHCIIDAKENVLAKRAPTISISELKVLFKEKNGNRRLINSILELDALVSDKLKEYQFYLQGDTPAIGDLWDTGKTNTRPRDEEYLSDHLARFLRLTMNSGVIINREVQIKRKLYEGGQSGSRTDLWIQAFDQSGNTLTLCIEVKCNWNLSAKSAIKDQLIDKYMSGGTAEAGILLLGWFVCPKWNNSDRRLSDTTKIWKDMTTAQTDLEIQAENECGNDKRVSAIVVDCSLR